MAIELVRKLVDDVEIARDPGAEVEATQTICFSVNGTTWEVDLSDDNAGAFFDAIRPFQEAGRRRKGPSRKRPQAARMQSRDIRAWARKEGMDIRDMGRVPGSVILKYKIAHGMSPA